MTSNGTLSVSRAANRQHGATRRAPANPVTLIAVALFLAVLIAEATFVALNATGVADLSALVAARRQRDVTALSGVFPASEFSLSRRCLAAT